jgi:uncharacterized cupredoxin-like copper-binding protein
MAETLFYVFGLTLVVCALAVSLWGLRNEERFPGPLALRLGTLLFVTIVGATTTFAVLNARDEQEKRNEELAAEKAEPGGQPGAPAKPGEAPQTLRFSVPSGTDLAFDQTSVEAKAGPVEIKLDNRSEVAHDVTIAQGTEQLGKTEIIAASIALTDLTLKPGEYVFYCSVPGHREAGMQGKLTVK